MASTRRNSNGRMVFIIGVLAFVAGCWTGMGSDATGDPYCVVTGASAAARPGAAPGQIVEPTFGGQGDNGCEVGEPQVCGRFEDDGDDRRFVSEECP